MVKLGTGFSGHIRGCGCSAVIYVSQLCDGRRERGTASVSIVLSPPVTSFVTVDFSTSDVYPGPSPAAQAGVHYQAQSGTLTFQPGEWIKTIQIGIIDNPDINQAHGFQVFLYNPVGGVLDVSGPSYAYVQIYDNELPNLVDAGFNTGSGLESYDESFGNAKAMVLQPDGKVLLGGDFNTLSGNLRKGFARLNANGSYDTNYNQGEGIDGKVYTVGLQSNGKVVVGGAFLSANQAGHTNVARFNQDGTVDPTFNPYTDETGEVRRLAIQPDGKILVGGTFTTMNGTGRRIWRDFFRNGTLDTTFSAPNLTNISVRGLALMADGRMLVAGNFVTNTGTELQRIFRLLPNGASRHVVHGQRRANGRFDFRINPSGRRQSLCLRVVLLLCRPVQGRHSALELGRLFGWLARLFQRNTH